MSDHIDGSPTENEPEPIDGVIEDQSSESQSIRGGRSGLRIAVVAFAAVVLIAAGIGFTRNDDDEPAATAAPRKLNLVTPFASERFASIDDAGGPTTTWPRDQYQLDGTLADLGSTGTVYGLDGPGPTDVDVAKMASGLGLSGTPVSSGSGWSLSGDNHYFEVYTSEGMGMASVSYSAEGQGFSAPGYAGSESTSSSGAMPVPSATVICDPDACSEPDTTYPPTTYPPTTYRPTTTQAPPRDLPDNARAERIARDLLAAMAVPDLNWSAAVDDGSDTVTSVGCAITAEITTTTCPQPPPPVMRSRQVTLTATIDGQRVEAVAWRISVGDGGVVEMASGTWGRPEAIADYPLRSTTDVFADLQAGTAFELGGSYARKFAAVGQAIAEDGTVSPEPPTTVAQPYVITITGVERGVGSVEGVEDGHRVAYLVPTYRYTVKDGGWVEVVAIDPSLFGAVTPPDQVEPQPAPAPEYPEPSSSPGVTAMPDPPRTATTFPAGVNGVTVEPGVGRSTTTTVATVR